MGAGVPHLGAGQSLLRDPGCVGGRCALCRPGRDHVIIGRDVPDPQAEHVLAPAANLLPIPGTLFPEAWHRLIALATRPGEIVPMLGAGCRVGGAASRSPNAWARG